MQVFSETEGTLNTVTSQLYCRIYATYLNLKLNHNHPLNNSCIPNYGKISMRGIKSNKLFLLVGPSTQWQLTFPPQRVYFFVLLDTYRVSTKAGRVINSVPSYPSNQGKTVSPNINQLFIIYLMFAEKLQKTHSINFMWHFLILLKGYIMEKSCLSNLIRIYGKYIWYEAFSKYVY
jgi:hypothetical protein